MQKFVYERIFVEKRQNSSNFTCVTFEKCTFHFQIRGSCSCLDRRFSLTDVCSLMILLRHFGDDQVSIETKQFEWILSINNCLAILLPCNVWCWPAKRETKECLTIYHSCNRWFPSCISPLFQSKSQCEAFHMEISFIYMQMNQNLCVNKTNFHMKDFALGLALKQRQNPTQKSPINWFMYYSI